MNHHQKIQHLYLRAGFGATPQEVQSMAALSLDEIIGKLFEGSSVPADLNFMKYPLSKKQERKGASAFKILKMILQSRREMEDLNIVWLNRMAAAKAPLREKMTFFWHNHFATSVPFGFLMQVQNNTLRNHALGKFSELLHAVAKDPAMIIYLNNQQNKKDAPNENFAREVMELFTLGEGNYSEKDIKEAARAFTGWTVNRKGQFQFNVSEHDEGEKEFLGIKGKFSGEDILNFILGQKQTALFITSKIYGEFVNGKIHQDRVNNLADKFFKSGYDISLLIKNIFSAEWFYDDENAGNKISSPVELIVRCKRMIDLQFDDDVALLNLQKALGQVLFFPPNVAGWKGGSAWIDSSSLLLRLNLAQSLLHDGKIKYRPKPEFEDKPVDESDDDGYRLISDWALLTSYFINVPDDSLFDSVAACLIQCSRDKIKRAEIEKISNADSKENRIIKLAANLMSLPEFQLI